MPQTEAHDAPQTWHLPHGFSENRSDVRLDCCRWQCDGGPCRQSAAAMLPIRSLNRAAGMSGTAPDIAGSAIRASRSIAGGKFSFETIRIQSISYKSPGKYVNELAVYFLVEEGLAGAQLCPPLALPVLKCNQFHERASTHFRWMHSSARAMAQIGTRSLPGLADAGSCYLAWCSGTTSISKIFGQSFPVTNSRS